MTKSSMKTVCEYIQCCVTDEILDKIEIKTKSGEVFPARKYSFECYFRVGDLPDELLQPSQEPGFLVATDQEISIL